MVLVEYKSRHGCDPDEMDQPPVQTALVSINNQYI